MVGDAWSSFEVERGSGVGMVSSSGWQVAAGYRVMDRSKQIVSVGPPLLTVTQRRMLKGTPLSHVPESKYPRIRRCPVDSV